MALRPRSSRAQPKDPEDVTFGTLRRASSTFARDDELLIALSTNAIFWVKMAGSLKMSLLRDSVNHRL